MFEGMIKGMGRCLVSYEKLEFFLLYLSKFWFCNFVYPRNLVILAFFYSAQKMLIDLPLRFYFSLNKKDIHIVYLCLYLFQNSYVYTFFNIIYGSEYKICFTHL